MGALRGVIWDVDGTLADTEENHRRAFNAAFGEEGLPWAWDQDTYAELLKVTGGKERLMHFLCREGLTSEAGPDPDGFVRRVHARKTELYTGLLDRGEIALRSGITRLTHEIREAGISQAIATTTSRPNVDALLRACFAGDGALFEAVVTGEEVQRKKPDPEVYILALERLGLAPEACLAVEDSRNGLLAARGAGIATLVVRNRYTRDEDFAGAVAVVDTLGDPAAPLERGTDVVTLLDLRAWHGRG